MPELARIQGLGASEKCLFGMWLAGGATAGVSPSKTKEALLAVRIPPPRNINDAISRLVRAESVVAVAKGLYAITPKGRTVMASAKLDVIPADVLTESTLAGYHHVTLPPQLAPQPIRARLSTFLEKFPFDSNVFCITPFASDSGDAFDNVIAIAKKVGLEYGTVVHVASDRMILDDLWQNVSAHIWSSRFGIVVLEGRKSPDALNVNVLIEAGAMLATGRRCLLLKDKTAPKMPTDLVGHIYKEVNLDKASEVEAAVSQWFSNDLAIRVPGK